nr:Lar family restriction alleviation protein [Brucella intermedia]
MASELKPCPFCGSDRITVQCIRDGQQAICKDCGSKGKPVFHGPKGPDVTWGEAVDAWNTRPIPVAPVSPDATGKCGELVTVEHQYWTPESVWKRQSEAFVQGVAKLGGFTRELVTRSQAEELLAAERVKADEYYGEAVVSYDRKLRVEELEADNAALTAKLETANALVTCCCGDPIDAHNMGSDHSPVDQYHYAMIQLEEQNAELTARVKELEEQLENMTAIKDIHQEKRAENFDRALEAETKAEALEAKLAAAERALEPFANAADGRKSKSVTGAVYFSQHYLLAARAVLRGKP